MLTPDGRTVWFRDTGRIVRDGEGHPCVLQGVMMDITERKQLEEERARISKDLVRLAEQLQGMAMALAVAEEQERKRLAHVLHDDLQQLVYGARLFIEHGLSPDHAGCPETMQNLKRASEMLGEALTVSRSLTSELSPAVLCDQGLAAALQWLGRKMAEDHRIQVTVDVQPDAEPQSNSTRVLVFHAVRELLLNVVKHSGVQAAHLALTRPESAWVEVVVSDGGTGFNPEVLKCKNNAENGFGLRSIEARLTAVGGKLQLKSAPGQGAHIRLRIPDMSA